MSRRDEIVAEAIQDSKSPRGRHILLALIILGLGLMFVTGISGYALYKSVHTKATRGETLAQQVTLACHTPGHKTVQIRRICQSANRVLETPPSAGPSGPVGPIGPPPSDAQVSRAVALYCQSGVCTGPGPSAGQVAQAVALYCDQNGQCRGPAGSQGQPGADGSAGPQGATGAQGPPPTSEQIVDAVNNYCSARNGCIGPKGDTGATGVVDVDSSGCQAQDGQVIQSVSAKYDTDTRKIVLTCTYADAIVPPSP